MVYINEPAWKRSGCIFCNACKEKKDKKNLILLRGEDAFIIMNRFPYSNGHLMIAPYRHIGEIGDLTDKEIIDLFLMLNQGITAIKKTMRPQAFNIGINLGQVAGAGVKDHIHIHLVPRWSGDTNFMPILCETKVISEALSCTYERLKKVL